MRQQLDFYDNGDDSQQHECFGLFERSACSGCLQRSRAPSVWFVVQNMLLLNPTERFLTEQSLNHHAFQTLRMVERPGPPTPTPVRSSKRKPHHGDNTTPSRSAVSTIFGESLPVHPHADVLMGRFMNKCCQMFLISSHHPATFSRIFQDNSYIVCLVQSGIILHLRNLQTTTHYSNINTPILNNKSYVHFCFLNFN